VVTMLVDVMGTIGAHDAAVVVGTNRGVLASSRLADPGTMAARVDLVLRVHGDEGVVVEAVDLHGSTIDALPGSVATTAVVDLLLSIDAHNCSVITSRDLGGSTLDAAPVSITMAVVDLLLRIRHPDIASRANGNGSGSSWNAVPVSSVPSVDLVLRVDHPDGSIAGNVDVRGRSRHALPVATMVTVINLLLSVHAPIVVFIGSNDSAGSLNLIPTE